MKNIIKRWSSRNRQMHDALKRDAIERLAIINGGQR
jgi:hypothetical protein